MGTGELPGPDGAEWCVVEVRAPDVIAEIRAAMRLLRLLPGELEDKVVVDDLWDELGVARAPSEVVPADPAALPAATRRLDRGAGTAWAGDARQGL